MRELEIEQSQIPRAIAVGGALAALAGGAALISSAEPAGAVEAPAPHIVTVAPGDSAWRLLDDNTSLTPPQITEALPGFYEVNHLPVGDTIHPNQQVIIPAATPEVTQTYRLKYGDVLWTLVEQHYGQVTPDMVQAVASASGLRDMNHYYANDTIVFPNLSPAPVPAPAPVEVIQPQPEATPKKQPEVTQDTAVWKAKSGPEVLNIINIVSHMENVPPATVAGWLRKANPNANLAKLKDGTSIYLPGVSQEQWKTFNKNLQHLIDVQKIVEASRNQAAAPGLTHPVTSEALQENYFLIPAAPNGEYVLQNDDPNVRAGSKALVDGIFTVAEKWNQLHPESKLSLGDLNAPEGHASHKNGVDVDISTVDKQAADIHGDRNKSIELAKMLADTGITEVIFYNDVAVQQAFNAYVKEKGLPGRMESWPNHDNHMHWRIQPEFRLPTSIGSPPPAPAPFIPPPASNPEAKTAPQPLYTTETNPLGESGVTAEQLDAYFAEHAPAMAGLGKAFIQIEKQYGINAIYAAAHAGNESSWGTSNIARAKNNLFGRNAYDSSPMDSALANNSYAQSVLEYGAFLKNAYLTQPGQPGVPGQKEAPGIYFRGFSLRGVFDLYSTAQGHDQIIANLMNQIDPQIRAK